MNRWTTGWASLLVLLTAGLAHARSGGLPLEVSVSFERPALPYVPAAGRLRVTNRSGEPLALFAVGARCAGEQVLDERLVVRLPARASKDGAQISGRLLVEQIGAQARLPEPSRWEWNGEDELATFPVLQPGRTLERRVTVRPTEASEFIEIEVRYAFVGRERLLGLRAGRREPAASSESSGASEGWVVAEHLTALFAPAARSRKGAERPVVWDGGETRAGDDGPVAYPLGLLSASFNRLEECVSQTRRALPLRRPVIGLEAARSRARVSEGRYAYASFPGLEAWVFEKKDGSVLVGAADTEVLPGHLVEVVEALNASESIEIELFPAGSRADPGELVAFLRSRRLAARAHAEKGGTWSATLRIRRAELRAACAALGERGARIEGMKVVFD